MHVITKESLYKRFIQIHKKTPIILLVFKDKQLVVLVLISGITTIT